jgi:GNAT superfamily N-acetyltransferase
MDRIRLLASEPELRASFQIMRQLRPHLSEDQYLEHLAQQQSHEHYRIAASFDAHGEIRAVAGFRVVTALAHGRFVYVDDLVSDEAARSSGHGKRLIDWIAAYGEEHGCVSLQLDSGVQRHDAHRFYLRERMDIVAYHFRKGLA